MSKNFRRTASFPASENTIDAQPEFHPGVETLAAEATHHEAVEGLEGVQTHEGAVGASESAPEAISAATIKSVLPHLDSTDIRLSQGNEIVSAPSASANQDEKGFVLDVSKMLDDDAAAEMESELSVASQLKAVMRSTAIELPDGSIRIPIVVPEEMVVVLKEWALGAGEPWEEYMQRMVEQGLNAIVLGGAVAG